MSNQKDYRSFRLTSDAQSKTLVAQIKRIARSPLFYRWAAATILLAAIHFSIGSFTHSVFAARLYLYHVYGYRAVSDQSLSLTAMPRGQDWTVSNGDSIPNGGSTHFLYGMLLWWPVMIVASVVITRVFGLSPRPLPNTDDVAK